MNEDNPTIKLRFESDRYLVICYGGISKDGESRFVWPAHNDTLFDDPEAAIRWAKGRDFNHWGVWDVQEARVVAVGGKD